MEAITTYTDFLNRPTALTTKELNWFAEIVAKARQATGCMVPIIPFDHDLFCGKSRNALGTCNTTDPENPLGEGVDTFITIDCYFIDECWRHEFKGDCLITDDSLQAVIAHEIAHLTVWRHGKKHSALTADILARIDAT